MLGILLSFVTLLTWSASDLVAKQVVTPYFLRRALFWGQWLGGLAILLVGLIIGEIHDISLELLTWALLFGVINLLGMTSFYKAIEHKGIALSLPIIYSWAVPSVFLSYFFLGQNPTLTVLLGIGTVILGLFLVCVKKNTKRWVDTGTLFGAVSMLTWAIYYYSLGPISEQYGEWTMSAIIKICTGLLIFPFSWKEASTGEKLTLKPFLLMGFVAITDGVGFLTMTYALQNTSLAVASGIVSTAPALVAACSIFWYKEHVSSRQGLGIGMTVLGLLFLVI